LNPCLSARTGSQAKNLRTASFRSWELGLSAATNTMVFRNILGTFPHVSKIVLASLPGAVRLFVVKCRTPRTTSRALSPKCRHHQSIDKVSETEAAPSLTNKRPSHAGLFDPDQDTSYFDSSTASGQVVVALLWVALPLRKNFRFHAERSRLSVSRLPPSKWARPEYAAELPS